MATGFLAAGKCYATALEAMSHHVSGQTIFVTPGTTTYINDITWDVATAAYRFKTWTAGTNGLWTLKSNVAMAIPNFPVCELTLDFDPVLFQQAFGGGLLVFVVGLGIGLVISTLRKTRTA